MSVIKGVYVRGFSLFAEGNDYREYFKVFYRESIIEDFSSGIYYRRCLSKGVSI